jgi:hypothetical protein
MTHPLMLCVGDVLYFLGCTQAGNATLPVSYFERQRFVLGMFLIAFPQNIHGP